MNSLIRQLKLNKDEFPSKDFLKNRKDSSIKESKKFRINIEVFKNLPAAVGDALRPKGFDKFTKSTNFKD